MVDLCGVKINLYCAQVQDLGDKLVCHTCIVVGLAEPGSKVVPGGFAYDPRMEFAGSVEWVVERFTGQYLLPSVDPTGPREFLETS